MTTQVPVIFQEKDSFVHRRDPRVKIALFLLLLVLVLTARSWEWMAVALIETLVLALAARAPVRWMLVLWLLHVPSFVLAFAIPLVESWQAGTLAPFRTSSGGMIRLVLAWTSAIVLSVALFSTTDARALTRGLRGLGVPSVVALAFQLSYRLLYALMEEAVRITEAMRMKGVRLDPRHPLLFVANAPRVAVPVTLAVMRQAPLVMAALHMRGIPRVPPRFGGIDLWDGALLGLGLSTWGLAAADALGWLPFSLGGLVDV